ncbi:MAG: anti-sigma factor [Gammaproteobacteria bacterium]|nr:anti-sigma factor [Gammaproteobacteria bacterium]
MSNTSKPVAESDLHAYLDRQISPQRQRLVEEYLQNNPREAQRLDQLRSLNNLLKQQHQEHLQKHKHEASAIIIERPPLRNPKSYLLVASVMFLFCGSLSGWFAHEFFISSSSQFAQYSITKQAAVAHAAFVPEVRHPVEVHANKEAHLFKWLSKRLHTDVTAPNLAEFGYALIGGRLLPNNQLPAAQFMYENKNGQRLTLYIRNNVQENAQTAFRFEKQDSLSMFYWINGALGYAVSAELPKQQLLNIAHVVYQQIDGE